MNEPYYFPTPQLFEFRIPEPSDWRVTLANITYRPAKGAEPNRFHRWMQELCFGVKWERVA